MPNEITVAGKNEYGVDGVSSNGIECIAQTEKVEEPEDFYDAVLDIEDQQESATAELGNRLHSVYKKIISESLTDGDMNCVFTPIAELYSMMVLSELSKGKSKEEILDLLGIPASDASQMSQLLKKSIICPQGHGKSVCDINSSIWIDKGMYPIETNLKRIFDKTGLESYAANMRIPETGIEIQKWLKEKTGAIMSPEVTSIQTKPEDAFIMLSSVLLKGKWIYEFQKEDNVNAPFFLSTGKNIQQEYMSDSKKDMIGEGSCFTTYSKEIHGRYAVTFILPNKNKSIADVISSDDGLSTLVTGYAPKYDQYVVHTRIPKFKVSAKIDMKDMMRHMGISSVFDINSADFSEIVANPLDAYLNKAEQNCTFEIDEEGIKGAGFVKYEAGAGCMDYGIPKDYYFYLDRPFLFTVTKRRNNPIFTGVIYNPSV